MLGNEILFVGGKMDGKRKPDNGARSPKGGSEEGVVMGEYGWRDEARTAKVDCFVCEFSVGVPVGRGGDALTRAVGRPQPGSPVLLSLAPDMSSKPRKL